MFLERGQWKDLREEVRGVISASDEGKVHVAAVPQLLDPVEPQVQMAHLRASTVVLRKCNSSLR